MPGKAKLEFKRIIEGCIAEKRECQNSLYRMYYPYGMSICIRYLESEDSAIFVLNEAFFKVFTNIKKYDQELSFKPWFRKIVITTAINHLRKTKKFKKEMSLDRVQNLTTHEDILSKIHYRELVSMVQNLSTAYRAVFNLHVIDGFKHAEIAKKMGITVGTSKSNLTRAKAKLRQMIIKELKSKHV